MEQELSASTDYADIEDDSPVILRFRSIAALGAIFGALGLAFLPLTMLRMHSGSFAGEYRTDFYYPSAYHLFADTIWLPASGAIGAGLSAALLIGSVGALGLYSWGKIVLQLWAIVTLVVMIPATFFYVWWFIPPWSEPSTIRQTVETLLSVGVWGIGIPLAIAMLIELHRPQVKAILRDTES